MLDRLRSPILVGFVLLASCSDHGEDQTTGPEVARAAPIEPEGPQGERSVEAITEKGAAAAPREELAGANDEEEPIAFDPTRLLRGRVVPDMELPDGEELEVTLGVVRLRPEVDEESAEAVFGSLLLGEPDIVDVATTTPLPDGTFEFPRPVEVEQISVRVQGRFVHAGTVLFAPGGDDDPGDRRFDLKAYVGGRVSISLDLQGGVTADERRMMSGDRIEVVEEYRGGGLHMDRFFGGELTEELTAEFGPLAPIEFSVRGEGANAMGHGSGLERRHALAPFHVVEGFTFDVVPGETLDVRVPMKRGKRLEGAVLREDGTPVSGAEVSIETHWAFGGTSGGGYHRRRADGEGRFVFEALPDTVDGMDVAAHGLRKRTFDLAELREMLDAAQPVHITLDGGRSVVFEVTAPDGRPVTGLNLVVRATGDGRGGGVVAGTTGPDGRVRLDALPEAGDLLVSGAGVEYTGPAEADPSVFQVRRARSRFMGGHGPLKPQGEGLWSLQARVSAAAVDAGEAIELKLAPAPTVRGRIAGLDAVRGAELAIYLVPEDRRMGMRRLQFLRLNGEGTFEVDAEAGTFSGPLLPGRYTAIAVARADGDERKSPPVDFEVGADDVDIEVSLSAGAPVRGHVVLEDGTPLADVPVTFVRIGEMFGEVIGKPRTTDAEGAFDFGFHPPGDYYVRAASPRHIDDGSSKFTIPDDRRGMAPLRLVMKAGGAVRIRVLDPAGNVVEDAVCSLVLAGGRRGGARPIGDDEEWSGALGPVAAGDYEAIHLQPGFGEAALPLRVPVAVEAGVLKEVVIRQVEAPAAILSGIVTCGGEPAPDLTVWISDGSGERGKAQTDREGRYSMPTMATGSVRLSCGTWSHLEVAGRDEVIGEGPSTLGPLEAPSGAIEGQIQGHAFAMGQAVVYRADDPGAERPFRYSGGSSNGHFRIEHLPDGRYLVTLHGVRGRQVGERERVEVEVKNGETVRGVELGAK